MDLKLKADEQHVYQQAVTRYHQIPLPARRLRLDSERGYLSRSGERQHIVLTGWKERLGDYGVKPREWGHCRKILGIKTLYKPGVAGVTIRWHIQHKLGRLKRVEMDELVGAAGRCIGNVEAGMWDGGGIYALMCVCGS